MLLQIRRIIPHGMFNRSESRHSRLDLKALNNFGDDNRQEKSMRQSQFSHICLVTFVYAAAVTWIFTYPGFHTMKPHIHTVEQ